MQPKTSDSKTESINYQLDILKTEIENINQTIGRIDEITQKTKNWAILTWAGSIALSLGQTDLRQYVILTAILPFFFWYIDAHWRGLQRRSGFRIIKISEFLNSELLANSIEQKRLISFKVLDPTGRQYKGELKYEKFVSTWKTLMFQSVCVFYIAMILVSLIISVIMRWL